MATTCYSSMITGFISLFLCSLLASQSSSAATAAKHYVDHAKGGEEQTPLAKGLEWAFYDNSCPQVETIIRKHLKEVFEQDIGLAAGLLRIHFHDCFVQGCDGSVLLDGTAANPSEQQAPPNLSLRRGALQAINDLQALIQEECGDQVVSCADIAAIAARDAVHLSGGPKYHIPLGRKDSLTFATQATVSANLPSPFSNATKILTLLATKGLDAIDTVALSGAHTIGLSHCFSFLPRLYPTLDPTLDPTLAAKLKIVCPTNTSTNTTNMDSLTPNTFDNKYYVNLVARRGLFTSDEDLFVQNVTKGIMESFAEDEELFFDKFVKAIIKMGQVGVLTGTQGEIRLNCSLANAAGADGSVASDVVLETVVDDAEGVPLRDELQ
ncbi:Peroxidase 12-like protein [Drosera capensis]